MNTITQIPAKHFRNVLRSAAIVGALSLTSLMASLNDSFGQVTTTEVTAKNGEQCRIVSMEGKIIEGKFVSKTTDAVTITVSGLGDFVILMSNIASFSTNLDEPKFVHVKLSNGKDFEGQLISQSNERLILRLESNELIELKTSDVKSMELYNEKPKTEEIGETFSTRYFFNTNGFRMKKGESYVIWSLIGADYQVQATEKVSFGVITSWFGTPVIGSAKYSTSLNKNLNMSAGLLAGSTTWGARENRISGALPYMALTYGTKKANVGLSAGYGIINTPRSTEGRLLLSATGMVKVSNSLSLVFDSFIMPKGSRITETVNHHSNSEGIVIEKRSSPGFALIMPGIRWQVQENKAFQLGLGGLRTFNSNGDQGFSAPVPMLQWFRKL